MSRNSWRIVLILIALILGGIFIYPSIIWYRQPRDVQDQMRQRRNPMMNKILNLGLDLQGGIHMVLELQTDKLPDDKPQTVREAVERAIEVIRNRVDAYGMSEPLIVAQGDKFIVVQLPGVTDREQARSLIGHTALLEFRVVESLAGQSELLAKARELNLDATNLHSGQMPEELKKMLPAGTELLPGKEGSFYLVKDQAEMNGSAISNARVEMGGDYGGMPVVALEFNPEGARRFADVTEANIQKQLAIVLDGVVQSAPVIRTRIPDGRAVIEGQFTADDAKLLKTVLQAGALPAPLTLAEERTVGPTLGDDSIKAGLKASLFGLGLIIVFMAVYYKLSGMLADIALLINLFLLLAAMAALHATLTMPGIAGIILTLGMAVDANVLIFERMREELRRGKTPRLAIDHGYDRAFSAILDGHCTSLIAAAFLFQFGTGPIKGFGVSLSLGLIISLFTAIIITRAMQEFLLEQFHGSRLSV